MKLLLILAFAFTLFNTGLIWIIQVVHYPGFLKIGPEMYQEYQQFHMKSITMVVGPSMLLELLCSGALMLFISTLGDNKVLYILSMALLGGIWLHTALWAVPLHGKLVEGYNKEVIEKLVSVNWWRTLAWSLRAILIGWMLYRIV